MSKRIEQSRKHGPFDPRHTGRATPGRVSVVTPRNPVPAAPPAPDAKTVGGAL